jgi:fructokinase
MSFLGWDSYPVARLNGDAASIRVKDDFNRWGVHLDFAECFPTTNTPIIVQKISQDSQGKPVHVFNWECLQCGRGLPRFKPVTEDAISPVLKNMGTPAVFFTDRLSNASLIMAKHFASRGSLVVFEPSVIENQSCLDEMLNTVHVIKYSDQRLNEILTNENHSILLEIQSLGSKGLRYRRFKESKPYKWTTLKSFYLPFVKDTCGSGDWLTSGFLYKIASNGLESFKLASKNEIEAALIYGQALSAWNCGFEGARGGMYTTSTKKQFNEEVNLILNGERKSLASLASHGNSTGLVSCPSCQTNSTVNNYF